MKPITLSDDQLEVLGLVESIELDEELFEEKGRYVEYREAFVNCDTENDEILAQSKLGFHVLRLFDYMHAGEIDAFVEEQEEL